MNEDKNHSRQFERNLGDLADRLNVGISRIKYWRDKLRCPALQKRPYNVHEIQKWLETQAASVSSVSGISTREKTDLSLAEKSYYVAIGSLGVAVFSEVRQWANEI